MNCRHLNVIEWHAPVTVDPAHFEHTFFSHSHGRVVTMVSKSCLDCDAIIPLGHSIEVGRPVESEIKAAELARTILDMCDEPVDVESWAWSDCPLVGPGEVQCRQCEAEDLARVIAEHHLENAA